VQASFNAQQVEIYHSWRAFIVVLLASGHTGKQGVSEGTYSFLFSFDFEVEIVETCRNNQQRCISLART
jgi:hypothetical protein